MGNTPNASCWPSGPHRSRRRSLAVTLGIGTAVATLPPPTVTTPPAAQHIPPVPAQLLSSASANRQPRPHQRRHHRGQLSKHPQAPRGKPPRSPTPEGHRSHYQCRRSREGPQNHLQLPTWSLASWPPWDRGSSTTKFPESASAANTSAPAAAATATPSNVTIGRSPGQQPARATIIVKGPPRRARRPLKFANNASATMTVTLPPDFTSVIIRAKGDQYNGAPIMTVSVDGTSCRPLKCPQTAWTGTTPSPSGNRRHARPERRLHQRYQPGKGKDRNLQVDRSQWSPAPRPSTPLPPGDSQEATPPFPRGGLAFESDRRRRRHSRQAAPPGSATRPGRRQARGEPLPVRCDVDRLVRDHGQHAPTT